MNFKWRTDVKNVTNGGEGVSVGSTRTCQYDGKVEQTKAIRGVDEYDYEIKWEMVTSEPAVTYSSARYSVKLEEVTMTEQTLVIFSTTYSNDATITVVEDQKYKLRDGLEQMQKDLNK